MVLLPCTRYCCWLLVVGYYYLHLNLSHEEELTSTRAGAGAHHYQSFLLLGVLGLDFG
jgi:hypothetical protein